MPQQLPVLNPPPRVAAVLDHLTRRMRSRAEARLTAVGLRPRHLLALTLLRDGGGEATQQALAGELEIDKTNLVGLLNELEGQGLVARRRAVEDRRRHIVGLTDDGRRKLAEAEFALAAVEDVVLAALSAEEREQLYGLLSRATAGDAPGGAC